MLGVACEEGFVTVVDCSKPLPSSITGDGDVMPLAHWKAHRSGIHDLAWVKVRAVLVHGVDWGHMATDAEQHIALSPNVQIASAFRKCSSRPSSLLLLTGRTTLSC